MTVNGGSKLNIAIVGTGAIATLFWYYWRTAKPVILQRKLTMAPRNLVLSEDHHVPVDAKHELVHEPNTKDFDLILITVKHYQIPNLIDDLKPWLKPHSAIAVVQNGMGGAEQLVDDFPNNTILAGTTTDAVYRKNDIDYHLSAFGHLDIGLVSNPSAITMVESNKVSLQHDKLSDDLVNAIHLHPDCTIHNNILPALYRKLAVNAVINPLSAILKIKNGELQQHKERVEQIKSEVFAWLSALNTGIDSSEYSSYIDLVVSNTANNYSSMYQDIAHKRKTEIDGVLGYILDSNEAKTLNLPELRSMYHSIKQLEKHKKSGS